MNARWMPLFAAALGVLGGVGGALIGGYLANEGAERRFDQERAAQLGDQRSEAYGNFLGTSLEVSTDLLFGRPEDEQADSIARLYVTQAKAIIAAHDQEVTAVETSQVTEILDPDEGSYSEDQLDAYVREAEDVFRLARSEITAGE
jgi:hypothetical protein